MPDDISNQVAYAHGIPAVAATTAADRAALPRLVEPAPNGRLRMQLTTNPNDPGDLVYIIEESTTLLPGSWTEILRHNPGQSCSYGSLHVTTNESTGTATVEFPEVLGSRPTYFTRMRLELDP